ncbi:OmpA family protein [Herbaspirillum rubrisubalbicans Os34]|uniref:OmpA family protein n=1 Tax=Herbaspirillum rubrisubalbicans Os34 TaxID=1235827 RepID=A0A6M3ZMN6_9BURK|nr:OmpA family protein [Herbaspirillum rubrisubalbicans]QJP99848.1 OmpA family protein [Herbaspirillum rubrisubalbicans Os34]
MSKENIDLIHSIDMVLSPDVMQALSVKIGLPSEILRRLTEVAGPTLIISLMCASISSSQVARVYRAINSPTNDARFAREIDTIVEKIGKIKEMESAGGAIAEQCLTVEFPVLCEFVAMQVGVPVQAAYVMTSLVAATLFSVIKHHMLLVPCKPNDMVGLFMDQAEMTFPKVGDQVAELLYLGSAENLKETLLLQLNDVLGKLVEPEEKVEEAERTTLAISTEISEEVASAEISARRQQAIALWKRRRNKALLYALGLLVSMVVISLLTRTTFSPFFSKTIDKFGFLSRPLVKAGAETLPSVRTQSAAMGVAEDAGPTKKDVESSADKKSAEVIGKIDRPLPPSSTKKQEDHRQEGWLIFAVQRDGNVRISAAFSSESDQEKMLAFLNSALGTGRFQLDAVVDNRLKSPAWLNKLDGLTSMMKVSGSDMSIDGNHIEIGGVDEKTGASWTSQLKELFGDEYEVTLFDADKLISDATEIYKKAIKQKIDSKECDDIDHTLNLQFIYFAKRSAELSRFAQDNLQLTAQLLKQCISEKKIKKISIDAFSDSSGNAKTNLTLTQHRANSVRDFLIKNGVSSGLIQARGRGEEKPVAKNMTDHGRFLNRRVEFSTEGES